MRGIPKNRRTILVSFSGIDGAGKSTQIANLQEQLNHAAVQVHLITFWDDVAKLKSIREGIGHRLFKGDKGVGTPVAPIHRRDKNVRSPLITLVRMAIYVVDMLSLRRVTRTFLESDTEVVIFDRYLYDELANLNLRNTAIKLFAQAMMKLAPQPEISFVLDADPVQARVRKPEYPLEFLFSNRASYLMLADVLPGITVIPDMPLEEAKIKIVGCVFRQLFDRNPPRRA